MRASLLCSFVCVVLFAGCGKSVGPGGSGTLNLGSGSGSGSGGSTFSVSSPFMQIASNNQAFHTCAASLAGNVYCWGGNAYGELGVNNTTDYFVPIESLGVGGVGNLSNITGVTTGQWHTCALSSAGTVYCWGDNSDGELGDGTLIERNTPVLVNGVGGGGTLSGIVDISGEQFTTCAVSSAGNVYCWGNNSSGQAGSTYSNDFPFPEKVEGVGGVGYLSGISTVAGGLASACALSSAGNVYCWGTNGTGELGNGTTTDSTAPVEVEGVGGAGYLSNIVSIGVGGYNACAVSSAGNVYCWGQNGNGEIGDNTTTQRLTPVEVLGVGAVGYLSGIASVAVSVDTVCAVSSAGNVYCWGGGMNGALGYNSAIQSNVPVQVDGVSGLGNLSGIVGITAGNEYFCGLSSGGNLDCWGDNLDGQVGNSTSGNQYLVPIETKGVGGVGFLSGI